MGYLETGKGLQPLVYGLGFGDCGGDRRLMGPAYHTGWGSCLSPDGRFREEYGNVRVLRVGMREDSLPPITEHLIQCIWYDQFFSREGLHTTTGRGLQVIAPGWWNRGEGPDFKDAQLEFDGRLVVGDVEIHLTHGGWVQHGHHRDPRYNDVALEVVFDSSPPPHPTLTSEGQAIQTLLLPDFLEEDIYAIADRILVEEYPYATASVSGKCSDYAQTHGPEAIGALLNLAGEWRILMKAHQLRDRMERVGPEQAVYESFMAACGYSPFKHPFRTLAEQLHYERVRQLARQDPLLVETAFFQLAGLFPEQDMEGSESALDQEARGHLDCLMGLRKKRLAGLRPFSILWRRVGVRPGNSPERRLAGAARFFSRTADDGLLATLESIWDDDLRPVARRRAFEALFPGPMGFWSTHCCWTGKRMACSNAPLGAGRVRSIIGNVFVPAALAMARREKDREREEQVLSFFGALPKEAENRILRVMRPRILGLDVDLRLDFRSQQGLLQLYQDWCEPNPSCRHCSMYEYLVGGRL